MPHLHALYLWCLAHPAEVLALALFVAANVYNRLQAGPAKAALARVIDRLSALNRAGADKPLSLPLIGRSTFDAVVTPAVPPAPIEPRRGFAAVDALAIALGVGALAFTAVALAGCPTWVRPACGAPGAYSCVANQPHVCSPSGALTPVGDQPCARSRGQCAMSDAGVAHCAPLASDGGAQ